VICGVCSKVFVKWFAFQSEAKMSIARVYVGRLSNFARDRDVERFFKGFGRIKDIMIKNGYCFVVGLRYICINLAHLFTDLFS